MLKLRFPQLRHGLVGSWCPSLGATGFTLLDRSGYGNHGTLTNMDPGTDWVASGGKLALDFDGSNDYVSIPSTSHQFGSGDFTISAWARWTSTASNLCPIERTSGLGSFVPLVGFRCNRSSTGDISGWIRDTGGGGSFPITASGSYNDGNWHAMTLVRLGNTGNLYVDGVLRATATNSTGSTNSTQPWRVGSSYDPLYFVLNVDAINIHNRGLAAGEVAVLHRYRGIEHETYRVPIVRGVTVGGGPTFKPAWAIGSNVVLSA